mmetsp:Transcript_53532/g.81219  ORF Transcript_53532/g.81219 Transcript_53532/m.81219 type:complete len:189 (+) Transcript_53532:112-678(+)
MIATMNSKRIIISDTVSSEVLRRKSKTTSSNRERKASNREREVSTRERKVCFAPHARLRRTLHTNNYSDAEYRACWYTKEEMIRIRHNASAIATIMEAGYAAFVRSEDPTEQKVSFLGLEHRTASGRRRQSKNRFRAWEAVFAEQERQKTQGTANEENVARKYREISHVCQVKATMSALVRTKSFANR